MFACIQMHLLTKDPDIRAVSLCCFVQVPFFVRPAIRKALAPLPPFSFEDAARHYQHQLDLQPSRPQPRVSLARTFIRLDRKEDAKAQLEAFLAEAQKEDRLRGDAEKMLQEL